MNNRELLVAFSLAIVYSFNLLGIFLLLPVMVLYASKLHYSTMVLAGFAFGSYGLMRLFMQLPLGMLSDKWGRKPIIYIGLVLFILGSLVCGVTDNIFILIIGRLIQGSGAVGAVVTALLTDLTSEESRTKSFAIVGIMIAITFSLSMVISPMLAQSIGVNGIFILTGILALMSIILIAKMVPNPMQIEVKDSSGKLSKVLKNSQLLRLNFGVFCLHFTQMSLFVALPIFLVKQLNITQFYHWHIYLPAVILGFIGMLPFIIIGEKKAKLKLVMLIAIILLLIVQVALSFEITKFWFILFTITIYFIGFNILEAILPSLISKMAPIGCKGTALGINNTCQSLGLFLGAAMGGVVYQYLGINYIYLECAFILFIWFIIALFMINPHKTSSVR